LNDVKEFDFDGMSIAYEHAGSGTPIVFLHNLGGSRQIWRAQLDTLQHTHSVYALDWFGYGDSTTPTRGYTIENYQRMLSSFIDAHSLHDVTLVGNCFGSAMSLEYARVHPANVRSLVLINPLTKATLRPTRSGLAARSLRKLPIQPLAAVLRLPRVVAGLVVREQLGKRGRSMDAERFRPLVNRWTAPRSILPVAAILPELPQLADLDTFEPPESFPPITTIWGQRNQVLSATAGDQLDTTLKPREAVVVPDCGHLVMMESPELVTRTVQARLTADDPQRTGP
jgi:pimeloyl-ACP methyl ester carboxylesterase